VWKPALPYLKVKTVEGIYVKDAGHITYVVPVQHATLVSHLGKKAQSAKHVVD
jgi:archaellum component FlaF (FlaF/FlaG flagellin family)